MKFLSRPSMFVFFLLSVIAGSVYLILVTSVSQAVVLYPASGGLVVSMEKPISSKLICQNSSDPKYFWGKPFTLDLSKPKQVDIDKYGLDPYISPTAAEYQIERVARSRKLRISDIRALIAKHTEGRQWGHFGKPRVNVLELNVALDAITSKSKVIVDKL